MIRLHSALLAGAVVLSSLAGGCAATSNSVRTDAPAAAIAEPNGGGSATDFTLRDIDGKQVSLSDYLGKQVILIDFWATWCVPCEAELPHLQALYKKNHDRGFVVLGVAIDGPETAAQVNSFVRRYALSFPVLLDEETKVVAIYNPKRTAPLSVLIDKSGQIARVRAGYSSGDEKLIAADVEKLIAPAASSAP